MTLGEWTLAAAVALGAAALAATWRWPRAGALLARAHAAFVLASLGLLLTAFLTSDVSYAYVWGHTHAEYPSWYKLAGLWGGEEGTLLLWNAAVALFLVLVTRKQGGLHRRAATFLLALSLALSFIEVLVGAFAATTQAQLALAANGRGLADVLLTPLMVIHPPIQFVGYALISVPAAYALAHFASQDAGRGWVTPAYKWARVAWLFATAGLGLGALWAYYVLSFGGYWAWDPVETSNLLPWLALTAFLHAGKHLEKFGDMPLSSAALAIAAMLLTLFATFATRSGLWVSVHAFTDPTGAFEADPAARLLAILDAHAPTRLLLALLLAALFASIALFALSQRGAARHWTAPLFALAGAAALDVRATVSLAFEGARHVVSLPIGLSLLAAATIGAPLVLAYLAQEDRKRTLDARTLMTIAAALLALATVVAFLVNVQVINGPDRAVFDVRAPFVVLPIVSVLTVMMALAPMGRTRALLLAGSGAALGLVAWALFPGARTVALATPFLLAALAAILLKLAHVQGKPRKRTAGIALLAAGLALIALSSNPPTYVAGASLSETASLALGIVGIALGAFLLVAGVRAFRGTWRDGARLRETGIYVIHLAVILGLLGYAASTYSQSREVFAAQPVGTSVAVGDYAVAIGAPTVAGDAGRLDRVAVPLALARGGGDAGAASLDFAWRSGPDPHYAPRLEVRRTLIEDVYISPLAFHTANGWVGATTATGERVPLADVDAVTFTVSVLPLMGLVWTGLWMGVVGMTLVIAGSMLTASPAPSASSLGRPQRR